MLAIKGIDGVKEVAQLWVTELIDKTWLHTTGQYKSWSVKVTVDEQTVQYPKNNLRSHGPLGPGWTGDTVTNVMDSNTKVNYVHQQLRHMDDTSFRGGLEDKIKIGHYPFTYDGEIDSAPDPGNSVEYFKIGKFVAVEF